MDFDTLAACGSMAGSGGVIIMDDTRDMVEALNNINEFYAHESCGQCTPCREGSLWMKKITDRILAGGGVERDPDILKGVADNIAGKTICASAKLAPGQRKASSRSFARNSRAKASKPLPPPMPPEYNPDELIEKETIEVLHDARTGSPLAPAALK
jgi:NADH-quinone oxidoreductase subunit F